MKNNKLKIALPSKGRLDEPTIEFFEKCALTVRRENKRQYEAKMGGIAIDVEVIFQRARDIPKIVEDGGVDLGVTGFDLFCEMGAETKAGGCIPVFPEKRENNKITALPYGRCTLVIAVPDHWVDTVAISDLAELSMARKKDGNLLRVATEFPNLTKNHLFKYSVSYFSILEVYGAVESAPKMGSADFVADLKSSGVTLKENRLKIIEGGKILDSYACLLASKVSLQDSEKRLLAKQVIDRIESHLNAKRFWLITANISASSEEELLQKLSNNINNKKQRLLGQEGPTIAKVLSVNKEKKSKNDIYSVSMQVESKYLEILIDVLRKETGKDILVTPISFVYDNEAMAYKILENQLNG